MSATGWVPPHDMGGWMRNIEKRMIRQERVRRIAKASDLLGPGFGPYATKVTDWNAEKTLFNGFFFSDEDEAVNSPDDTKAWLGLVISYQQVHGIQHVWLHDPTLSPVHYVRSFHVHTPGQLPTFTAWAADSGQVAFRVVKTANQSFADGTRALVTWDSTDYNDGAFDLTSNVLTLPRPGRYEIGVHADWQGNTSGRRNLLVTLNSAVVPTTSADAQVIAADNRNPAPISATVNQIITKRRFAAGDQLRVFGLQDSGVSLNMEPATMGPTELTVDLIGS